MGRKYILFLFVVSSSSNIKLTFYNSTLSLLFEGNLCKHKYFISPIEFDSNHCYDFAIMLLRNFTQFLPINASLLSFALTCQASASKYFSDADIVTGRWSVSVIPKAVQIPAIFSTPIEFYRFFSLSRI